MEVLNNTYRMISGQIWRNEHSKGRKKGVEKTKSPSARSCRIFQTERVDCTALSRKPRSLSNPLKTTSRFALTGARGSGGVQK